MPTDDAVISVYGSLDGSAWSATPLVVLVLDKDVDPNSIDFIVTGVYQFQVGLKRSGFTDTITSADLACRKDGVSVDRCCCASRRSGTSNRAWSRGRGASIDRRAPDLRSRRDAAFAMRGLALGPAP